MCTSNKTSTLCATALCEWNPPWPADNLHKIPVTRKMFPCHDIIIKSTGAKPNKPNKIRTVCIYLDPCCICTHLPSNLKLIHYSYDVTKDDNMTSRWLSARLQQLQCVSWMGLLPSCAKLNHRSVHYSDVIMGEIASQITSLAIVYSTVYSDADKKNIKAPRHWPLCGEFNRGRWIPRTNGQ